MMNARKADAVIVKIDEKLGLTKEKYRTMVILRSRWHNALSDKGPGAGKE